jgi:undecaprenyl-diphosphatase
MPQPLIAARWRGAVITAAVIGTVVVVALAAVVYHGRSTSFDNWVFRRFYTHIGSGAARVLLDLSKPTVSIVVLVVAVALAMLVRKWHLAALAAFGPLLAIGLTEFVFKPIVGRSLHPAADNMNLPLSIRSVYPSGHETTVASTAFVLIVIATQLPVHRALRAVLVLLPALWLVASAVGLVRNFWHYPTDTIGAICLSVAVIGCAALFIDAYGARLGPKIAKAARTLWRVDSPADVG